jgi:mRNA interferase HigB
MHVISRKKLTKFCDEHPEADDAREPLYAWFHVAERADWRKYADLKADYGSADVVGKYTVINIAGNKYRLIFEIFYESGVVLVRHALTHKEYDANRWREDAFKPTPGGRKAAGKGPAPRTRKPPKNKR